MTRKTSTSDFLKQLVGRPVVVKLNNGLDYRGVLSCLDGYMNIALEQTEEYVNGQLKNKYGDAFIRGNNGEFETPEHIFKRNRLLLNVLRSSLARSLLVFSITKSDAVLTGQLTSDEISSRLVR